MEVLCVYKCLCVMEWFASVPPPDDYRHAGRHRGGGQGWGNLGEAVVRLELSAVTTLIEHPTYIALQHMPTF